MHKVTLEDINQQRKYSHIFFLLAIFTLSSCKKTEKAIIPDPSISNIVNISGTDYPTVKIGTQTWTSLNYNGPGGNNYDNGPNEVMYGKLYSSEEANSVVTPAGWRLPSKADFEKLLLELNGQTQLTGETLLSKDGTAKLMSISGWFQTQGNNKTGFNARPTGIGSLGGKGSVTEFWSSLKDGEYEWVMTMRGEYLDYNMNCSLSKTTKDWSRSIRFVKDN
jgi:uncharacterized protein (TIGR02145 family)